MFAQQALWDFISSDMLGLSFFTTGQDAILLLGVTEWKKACDCPVIIANISVICYITSGVNSSSLRAVTAMEFYTAV